jgi:RHS repeat-associated protein
LTNITQQIGSTLLGSYAYTLDDAGNRLSVSEMGGKSTQWTYDNLYRLKSETRKDGATVIAQSSFTYDLTGNRLSQTVDGVTTNYTYNSLDQMLTAGSVQYEYDDRGNLKKEIDGAQIAQYNYDAANRLASTITPDGTTITNSFDADGRRVKQTVNAQVTTYLWDENSLYGDVVLETTGGVSTSYTLAGTQLISQTRNGSTSYYLQDGQGSTRALTNSAGAVTDTYSYTAYGEIYNQTGTTANNYLYTGQQFDQSTGLYSLRARFYNPAVGRFLSQDTWAVNYSNPIELNRYGYAAGNPVNASDPSGLFAMGYADTFRLAIGSMTALKALAVFVTATFVIGAVVFLVSQDIVDAPPTPDRLKPFEDWFNSRYPNGFPGDSPDPSPGGTSLLGKILRIIAITILVGQFIPVAVDTGTESTSQPGRTIVDLGSGAYGSWPRILKARNPNDRVIATETDQYDILKHRLEGSGVEVYYGWDSVPSEIADETWSIAPQPKTLAQQGYVEAGKAGLRITKPSGCFHMMVSQYEVSSEGAMRTILNRINQHQEWYIREISSMSSLGIPSDYIGASDPVWYIQTGLCGL